MKDSILEFIVKFSEGEDPLETAVTLTVGGLLISGHVISKAKYMQHNILTEKIQEGIEQAIAASGEEAPSDDGERHFIHLRDARYFSPGQPPTPSNEKITCRIKLSNVSAFHLGYLDVQGEA